MYRQRSPVSASLCLLAMCIVVAGLFSACAGSGGGEQYSANSENPDTLPAGTGGIGFKVVWQDPSSPSSQRLAAAFFNSCVDYGISTISATVSSGTTTITTKSWPCSLHQGLISGVPAGSNYTVQVNGLSSGQPLWSGQVSAVTVNTGQVTNAGTITMSYGGTDTTQPTVTLIGPNSSPTSTTNVPITDRIRIVFSEPMANSTVTSTNITVNSGSVPGTVSYDIASRTAAFIPSSALAYDTQYVLQVAPCVAASCIKDNAGNQLSSSYTLTFTTESAPAVTANAPAGMTTRPGNGQMTLDWPAVNGATSYNVYYGTAPGITTATGTPLLDVRASSVHLNLTNSTTYYYIITAVNSFGESLASAVTGTTLPVPAGNPLPPASLAVDYNGGASPYTVTWPTVAGMSYNLYWSARPIYPDHNAADNVIRYAAGGQYIHNGVTPGATYCYIVTAVNAAGESADSMQVCGPGAGSIQFIW